MRFNVVYIFIAVLLTVFVPLKMTSQVSCLSVAYTHHFMNTSQTYYQGRLIGGNIQTNGCAIAHTRLAKKYFINHQIAFTFGKDSIFANNSLATALYTVIDAGINFGITVPQELNDFMSFQLGGGLHYTWIKRENPGKDMAKPGASTELLSNFRYEFERCFVFATYSYMFTINEFDLISHRHGFRLGVQIPLQDKESNY